MPPISQVNQNSKVFHLHEWKAPPFQSMFDIHNDQNQLTPPSPGAAIKGVAMYESIERFDETYKQLNRHYRTYNKQKDPIGYAREAGNILNRNLKPRFLYLNVQGKTEAAVCKEAEEKTHHIYRQERQWLQSGKKPAIPDVTLGFNKYPPPNVNIYWERDLQSYVTKMVLKAIDCGDLLYPKKQTAPKTQ